MAEEATAGAAGAGADRAPGARPRRDRAAVRRRARARAALETRAEALERELRGIAQAVYQQLHGGDAGGSRQPFQLRLSFSWPSGGEAAPGEPLPPGQPPQEGLLQQIERQTRDLAVVSEALVPGRVYCYRCATARCAHCAPARAGHIFCGYGPTGIPRWEELGSFLVGACHERAGLLYDDPPQIVAFYQNGRELKRELLHTFGRASKTYDVLAQVACGYLRPPSGQLERVALTLQAIEWRGRFGAFRLSLNVIGPEPPVTEACLAGAERVRRAIQRAAAGLEAIERRVRAAERLQLDALGEVPRVMRELVRDVERQGRQTLRRTAHAEQRQEDRRPVHMAVEDVRRAAEDHFLYDERRDTIVVLGRRHRVHAFTPAGRHVTTMVLAPDAIDRRRGRGRWRAATSGEREGLRQALLKS